MNLKLLFVVNDDEKSLKLLTNEFSLPFSYVTHGEGTASQGILDFLGLTKTEKIIFTSIIPEVHEKELLKYIKKEMKIKEIGRGIAFTVPLSSSPKYIHDIFKEKKGIKMDNKKGYHLLITVVIEGYADKVMSVAKKCGANGGTLIKGREIGTKSGFRFFNVQVEPEKDILLIICKDEEKNKIMDGIFEKYGANTEAKGICVTLPIDNVIGTGE